MADGPVEPGGGVEYPSEMEARVAVLEQIAKSTQATLDRIERRLDTLETGLRTEMRDLRTEMAGFTGLLGVMAHGFHWL
jgi:hypothetical protein